MPRIKYDWRIEARPPRRANPPLAAVLDSNPHSRILTFDTEGATDRDIYRQLVE